MNQPTAEKMAKILERVRLMLAIADHPNTGAEEADTARTQAEALMFRYRIDAANLDAESIGASKVTPGWREFVSPSGQFANEYATITHVIVRHFDCQAVTESRFNHDRMAYDRVYQVVGFEAELQFVDLLMTECISAFGRYLEPKRDDSISLAANALRMRKAGMERNRIALVLLGDWDTENEMKAKTRRITKMVKEEAAAQGEDVEDLFGRGVNVKAYRETFAKAFVNTLYERLWRMAQSRGTEGAMVLASRKDAVREALYERYPHLRPSTSAKEIGEWVDPTKECVKCQKASSGFCREHGYLKPSKATQRTQRFSEAGYERGSAAARSVDLGRAGTQAIG